MLAISFGLKYEEKEAGNNFSWCQREAKGSNCYYVFRKGWTMGFEFNKANLPPLQREAWALQRVWPGTYAMLKQLSKTQEFVFWHYFSVLSSRKFYAPCPLKIQENGSN